MRPRRTRPTRRSASRCASGGRGIAGLGRADRGDRPPGPRASGMPNFWSSRAVARYSWVEACTPLLIAQPHRAAPGRARRRHRRRGRSRRRCRERSRPRRHATARSISARLLLLPCIPRRAGSTPAASATASSPPLQTSMREAGLDHPAGDLDAEERLARVVHVRRARPLLRSRRSERVPELRRRERARRPRPSRTSGVPYAACSAPRGDAAEFDGARMPLGSPTAARPPGASAFASSGWASHPGASGLAVTRTSRSRNAKT